MLAGDQLLIAIRNSCAQDFYIYIACFKFNRPYLRTVCCRNIAMVITVFPPERKCLRN